jgi:hypothetical protein
MTNPNPGGPVKTVADICRVAEMDEAAMALWNDGLDPRDYIAQLVEHELFVDAIKFLAHALPKRQAVWWAWVSAKRAYDDEPPEAVKTTLEITGKWIAEPTDEYRRAAMTHAEAVGYGTPAGSAALAAFLSGDSLAPPQLQAVAPPRYAAAKAISGAVILAAVSRDPQKANEQFQKFITQGLEVAEKTQLWGDNADSES